MWILCNVIYEGDSSSKTPKEFYQIKSKYINTSFLRLHFTLKMKFNSFFTFLLFYSLMKMSFPKLMKK